MGKGGWQRHLVVIIFTCLKYAKNKREEGGEGGEGEVVDISHNFFWLTDASNYKIFSFGLQM
jgi:hypothetical protein